MALKTYDPKQWDIVFAGIPLNEGLADGTFLSISTTTAAFTSKAGPDGEVTRVRQHDRRAQARFTTMQTSEVNDRLSAVLRADRAATNGQGVGMFFVQDRSGTTVVRSSKAYISDDPDIELAMDATTREWIIDLPDYDPTHGSNPDE